MNYKPDILELIGNINIINTITKLFVGKAIQCCSLQFYRTFALGSLKNKILIEYYDFIEE